MACSHCTEPGPGQGPGMGTEKNGFLYIMQTCSYCREGGPGPGGETGTGNLVMGSIPIFSGPGPGDPSPVPGSVQCERAISATRFSLSNSI